VIVSAPASIANLGCLFDLAALAVRCTRDTVVAEPIDEPKIEVVSQCKEVPSGKGNTAYYAAEAVLSELGLKDVVGVRISVFKGVEVGVGLGSSAATAAATAMAVNETFEGRLSTEVLIRAAGEGERAAAGVPHYDNVSASLLGGMILITNRKPLRVVRLDPPKGLKIIILKPKMRTTREKTRSMRSVLPRSIALNDMVEHNSAAVEFMVGLMRGDVEELGRAINRGGVIEKARSKFIPHYQEIKREALKAGGLGVNISGAGPSMFIITRAEEAIEVKERIERYLSLLKWRGEVIMTEPDERGAVKERDISLSTSSLGVHR